MSKINREKFLRCLEAVSFGLAARDMGMEQSSCFVFQKGKVITFNDEIFCRCPTEMDPAIAAAVPAKPILNILRKIPDEEVDVSLDGSELLIRGKGRASGINVEQEILLQIVGVEKPKEWKPLAKGFDEALSTVQECAGKDESRFALTCVHVHPNWLEAADLAQVCRWKIKTGVKAPTIVRRDSIKHVSSLGMIEFGETDAWLHFRNAEGLSFSCRRFVDPPFPELDRFLSVEGGQTVLLPKGLADGAASAALFSAEDPDFDRVLVSLRPGKLKLKGQGVSGWYSEGPKKINYNGPAFAFLISPQLLIKLVQKHNECLITQTRIKVESSNYTYVACLDQPKEKEEE